MLDGTVLKLIRQDCLESLKLQPTLLNRLTQQRIAVVGGTGFIGTWISETIAAINDELGGSTRVDVFGRSAASWADNHLHLTSRKDIRSACVDVRSSFELPQDTTHVLFAAGVADPRVQASDPHRVHETALLGIANSLASSSRLERLQRFVNVSSGLVLGNTICATGLKESDIGNLDFTRVHNTYAESRRAAENLVSTYGSQYKLPVTTARVFTFLGPYQSLDLPWAANNFIRDAVIGNHIKIHGDGSTRRSYLYGSDAATWLLRLLVDGKDGDTYNVGGVLPITHADVATMVASSIEPKPRVIVKSKLDFEKRGEDFFPDLSKIQNEFSLSPAIKIEDAIERSILWQARRAQKNLRFRFNGG